MCRVNIPLGRLCGMCALSLAKPTLARPGFIGTSSRLHEVRLGFLVAQSSRDEKEMPHGQAPWSCRFVLMLSTLFRAAFPVRAFRHADLRRSRVMIVRLLSGYWGRRARVGLGWPSPGPLGPALPLPLLITRAKNLYELKTRGVLAKLAAACAIRRSRDR